MVQLRWYSKRDIPAINLILSQVGERWHDEKLTFYLTSTNHVTMVALADTAVVGFMIYQLQPYRLVYLAVREDHRREGIATALLRSFISKTHMLRPVATCAAPDDNLELHLLLRKIGFTAQVKKGSNSYLFTYNKPPDVDAIDQVMAEGILV